MNRIRAPFSLPAVDGQEARRSELNHDPRQRAKVHPNKPGEATKSDRNMAILGKITHGGKYDLRSWREVSPRDDCGRQFHELRGDCRRRRSGHANTSTEAGLRIIPSNRPHRLQPPDDDAGGRAGDVVSLYERKGWFRLEVPEGWESAEEEGTLELSKPDGPGALQLTVLDMAPSR